MENYHHRHASELNEVLNCKIKLHLNSDRLTTIKLSNSADNYVHDMLEKIQETYLVVKGRM